MSAGYKLVNYRARTGAVRAGLLRDGRILDAASVAGGSENGDERHASMLAILEDWPAASARLRDAVEMAGAVPAAGVELLAPVLYPGAIYCAGANYSDHVEEMSRVLKLPREPDPHELGLKPWHFIKTARGSVVAHKAALRLPPHSRMIDWEAELAAVIGRPARHVGVAEALDYVAGYTVANDLSARDHLKRDKVNDGSPFKYDWISQKCFDGSCPLGPWITPAEDVADPQALGIRLWLNGELMQDSNTGRMIFTLAEQIAQLSSRITLFPGDVILTGTPAGVGMARGRFLKPGDVMRLWIEDVGELSNSVAA